MSTALVLSNLEICLKELAEKSLERWIYAIETASRDRSVSYAYRSHTAESLETLRKNMGDCVRAYDCAVATVTASGGPLWYQAFIALGHARILETIWGENSESRDALALVRQARIDYAKTEAGQQ